jgi:adenylate kinase family enzyme
MTVTETTSRRQFSTPRCRRIVVVGTTGSGKTTLARRISERLDIPHVELDAIFWGPNWTPAPIEDFGRRIAQALGGQAWVADGNYSRVRDVVWGRADSVVWLDYALPVIMRQLVRRTFRRVVRQEELWNDNRERAWVQLFSRDSLFLWALQTYPRRRREYPLLFERPEYAHLAVVHLRSPRATRDWLENLR